MRIFGQHEPATLAQFDDVSSRAVDAALMADGHVGYVMPIGGVAAYREQVSVVGVGFDIACLAAGTPVVTRDGYHVPIEAVTASHRALCWDGTKLRPIDPLVGHVARGRRAAIRLRLANGRTLVATGDHRLLTADGWRTVDALAAGDVVGCAAFVGLPFAPWDVEVPLDLPTAERAALAARGLASLRGDDPRTPALLRLLGVTCGDGHLTRDGKAVAVYTTDANDAADVAADFATLGFQAAIYRRARGPGRLDELCVRVSSRALHALFAALGSPVGRKCWPADPMPWLFDAPDWARAQFLSGLASAEMTTPRRHRNGVVPNLQLKQAGEDDHAIRFVACLCASLGFAVSVAPSGAPYGTRQVWVLQLLGGQHGQVAFAERVGFCYAAGKRRAAAEVASVVWSREVLVTARTRARDEARALHTAGAPWREVVHDVAARHAVPEGFVYHAIYDDRGAPRRLPGSAVDASTTGELCWMPIVDVAPCGEVDVYDVVTGDAAACFLANGVVAHNCGNAAIRTDLTLADLGDSPPAARARLESIADEIHDVVSFGMGRKNRADDAPVDHPLFDDPAWDATPVKHRQPLRAKARQQLGTVGSGNHYVDVFADEAGTLWVGVHFGSRGFGHTVASGFLAVSQGRAWGERVPEREVLLDLAAPVGHDYWHLMNLAGRYAYAGREWVARKVVQLMGARELDLVHNHHNFCVAGDAMVPTTGGPKRMDEIRAGDEVYAFDAERGLVPAEVLAHGRTGIRRTLTLRTASRAVRVTDDHPVLVVDVDERPHPARPWHTRRVGRLRFKPAGEIQVNDMIVCAAGCYPQDLPRGEDLARLAGAMLGDGWVRHEPSVQGHTVGLAIGSADEPHTACYVGLLERALPEATWRVSRPGQFGITCSSVAVWREVTALGLAGYSREKRLPRWAFRLPRAEKLALLAGYVDADGFVADDRTSNHGRVTLASTHGALVRDLRELALGCSLRASPVRSESVVTNFGPAITHRCVLDAQSGRELPLWHERKAGRLRDTRYRRPVGLQPSKLGYLTLPAGCFAQSVQRIDRSMIAEPVYDLTVDHPSHAFVCDGVVVHNCWKEVHDGQELVVVRKGATPAFPGQRGFVGGSMGDDAVIVQGTTDPTEHAAVAQRDALFSTVHGAGRVMSRTAAAGKRNRRTGAVLSPGRISPEMMQGWLREKGVILRGGGLDEAPQAYRRLPEVLAAQEGTVQVLHTLRPLVVVMAGADEFDPYKD